MLKIYSVEAYHFDIDAWRFIGDFISYEEAEKVVDTLSKQHPTRQFGIFTREIAGTHANFLDHIDSI